ncbi:MAG: TonB-dependent receptor, partial [Sphingobacteriaceae bacterium]
VNFNQKNLFTGDNFRRQFINWFPQASIFYKFSQNKMLQVRYYGATNQPSIQQIQPVSTGNNILNQTLGNPGLTPSFKNTFYLYYSSYKVLSEMYFMVNGDFSYTINPIVNNVVTTAGGASTYQAFNLPGKNPNNFSLYSSLQKKLKKLDLNVDFTLSTTGNTYYNLVNNDLNISNANNYSARIGLSQYKTKKYDFYGSFGPYYATGQSSLQKDKNNNGTGYNASGNINIYLPFKFQLQTDFSHNFQSKTQSFDTDFHQSLWNATITKKFLKQDNLRLSISGYDLLNQKTGFSRNTYNNSISQTTTTTIRRLFMFSVVYEFNKMGGAKKE